MRTRNHGFTLIELLVTLAIVAILTALATASYAAVKSRWDAEEARAALYTGFFTAKTQALAGGIQTVICPSMDGQYCLASNQWHHGWIVFQDANQNREHEANEGRLTVQRALSSRTIWSRSSSSASTDASLWPRILSAPSCSKETSPTKSCW